jgi:hypothetical protein
MDYQPGLKAILDNSGTLVNWGLAMMGGSVAALIGTSYERPKTRRGRMMYCLFPVAWIFLGLSVRTGEQISGRFIAAQLAPTPENVRAILMGMNHDFVCQYLMLLLGLLVMFAWLIWFLVWWIFFETKGSEKKHSPIPPSRATSGD